MIPTIPNLNIRSVWDYIYVTVYSVWSFISSRLLLITKAQKTISYAKPLAQEILDGIRNNAIVQFKLTAAQKRLFRECLALSKAFFKLPPREKAKHVDERSFGGWIASGEEITDGKEDYSEIFTVIKDLPLTYSRVQANWPGHGPCPWPSPEFQQKMNELMNLLGESREILLQLIALGLGIKDQQALNKLTKDGWHHMRILRYPALDDIEDKPGRERRGIGAHTDYGLMVFVLAEMLGGDFMQLKDGKWVFVEPEADTMISFPGDMLQILTNNDILATPHKIALNTKERFAFAYFHEPNFNAVIETLPKFSSERKMHYGSHLTESFMRNYSERVTAKRVLRVGVWRS